MVSGLSKEIHISLVRFPYPLANCNLLTNISLFLVFALFTKYLYFGAAVVPGLCKLIHISLVWYLPGLQNIFTLELLWFQVCIIQFTFPWFGICRVCMPQMIVYVKGGVRYSLQKLPSSYLIQVVK